MFLAAACSSASTSEAPDASSGVTPDAGAKADAPATQGDDPPDARSGTYAPADPTGHAPDPYAPPRAPASACSPAELDLFETCVQKDSPGPECDSALKLGASPSKCTACIYSEDTDSEWGPVVVSAKGKGAVNLLGCIDLRGGRECVEALRTSWGCLRRACAACSTDDACEKAARAGVCKTEVAAGKQACPVGGVYDSCAPDGSDTLAQLMIATRVFCGSALADAGSD